MTTTSTWNTLHQDFDFFRTKDVSHWPFYLKLQADMKSPLAGLPTPLPPPSAPPPAPKQESPGFFHRLFGITKKESPPKRGVRRATSQAITHQLEACRSDYLGLRQVIDRIDHYLTETEVFAKTYGSASSSSDLEQLDSTLGELVAGQRCLETFAAGFHTLYQKNRAAIQLWQPVTTEMDWDLLQTRLAVQAKQWGDTLLGLLRYKEDPIDYEPIDQRQWIQVNCCKQVFARDPLVQWLRQKQDNGCPLCNSTDTVRRQVLGS